VGIVYPFGESGLGDPRFVEVVAGISDGLAGANLELLVAAARPQTEIDTYRRLTSARTVDALIVANTRLDDPRIKFLQERDFPFVAYGRTNSPVPYAWFDFDNQAGACVATERLIGFGHRRIALIHGPLDITFPSQRRAGYCDAMKAAAIELDPDVMIEVPLNRMGGYNAMQKLLALPVPPSAVLVDNNLSGVGALRAIGDAGKTPRRDVSLIVYDGVAADIPLPYRVTSVVQPTGDSSGRTMAQLVIDVLAGKPIENLHHLAQARIEAGETDGPPL